MISGYCRRMRAQLLALEFAESVTDRFARVNYVCGNNVCGDRPYPRHLFDGSEDMAYFPYPDRSPLWHATTQLAKASVYGTLRGNTLHVKPHPLNQPTDPDHPVSAPERLIT